MSTLKKARGVEREIWERLKTVLDPELHLSLVELGLIYDVTVKEEHAVVTMTLTTIGCPLFGVKQKMVEEAACTVQGCRTAEAKLVFEPPWTIDKVSMDAKVALGLV